MSLDVSLHKCVRAEIFSANITHNLTGMAHEADLYGCVWHPKDLGFNHARDLVEPLRQGIARLKANPDWFKRFEPSNGWGTYAEFGTWLEKYLDACVANPDAEIEVSR